MPTVIWLNDRRPASTAPDSWPLTIADQRLSIAELRGMAEPVTAVLDCTGGWWSEQSWDAVHLSTLLPEPSGRSIVVTSQTGYRRRFPVAHIESLHLAVGYGGSPLRPGHGAPVRLIAPGRRGPEWVKWVIDVRVDNRPWWLQAPLPPT
jgi:DMSO/TMAO reductase YedYZ molybdopterin-dependent catalytic subunit